jgi:UDP-N-acetylglucosamine diphosphorylase / glucose-1-phosphate thymidylyltransferase / UDP-N-acetylgalactosamine diphosphorylase / glucosamine-1-phosphate N-acetyltransferase / galactosamine-1-phosphate N-acetyltransferase
LQIIIVEDIGYRKFLPLTATRPVFDLICGTRTIADRILSLFSSRKPFYIIRDELRDVFLERNPGARLGLPDDSDWLCINGRALVNDTFAAQVRKISRKKVSAAFYNSGEWVGYYVPNQMQKPGFEDLIHAGQTGFVTDNTIEIDVSVVQYPWDIIDLNGHIIGLDFTERLKKAKKKTRPRVSALVNLINRKHVLIEPHADIQPFTVIDASHGPVLIDSDVMIQSHVYLSGPVWIGPKTIVRAGARVFGGTSIGYNCRVGGEVSASIIHRHSNKAHDGFLGHAYVGEWVNIGAATNNSNLKNDYGPVSVMVDGEPVNTGKQFFGMVMGDHSRTAINTTINTGSNIGVGCNIFGTDFPPKFLFDFSWGGSDILRTYDFDKFLESARAMTARRDVELTEAEIKLLKQLFELRKRKK